MATIIFNGKSYNTPDEMSAADRAAFEQLAGLFVDKNGNGIPDFLEGDIVKNVNTAYTNIVSINGNMVNASELPEEMRTKVQAAFQKMAELGIVADQPVSMVSQGNNVQIGEVQSSPIFTPSPSISQQYPSTIQEGNRPSILQWALLGLFLFFCLAIAALGVVFYFMR